MQTGIHKYQIRSSEKYFEPVPQKTVLITQITRIFYSRRHKFAKINVKELVKFAYYERLEEESSMSSMSELSAQP